MAKARIQPTSDVELEKTLRFDAFEGRYVDDFGQADVRYLVKTFKFRGFGQSAQFMGPVAEPCRVVQQHPEWRNVFDQVPVSPMTWDARGRVTIYDLNLALFMNTTAWTDAKG